MHRSFTGNECCGIPLKPETGLTPISCHAVLERSVSAPFIKERRMECINATGLHRKSGQWGTQPSLRVFRRLFNWNELPSNQARGVLSRLSEYLPELNPEVCPDLVLRKSHLSGENDDSHLDILQVDLPSVSVFTAFGVMLDTATRKPSGLFRKQRCEFRLPVDNYSRFTNSPSTRTHEPDAGSSPPNRDGC
jgi:hypothetical protein